ncbi:MAG: hypothetical protein WBD28_00095 [Candidatus Zixiibacteriota bacterium]
MREEAIDIDKQKLREDVYSAIFGKLMPIEISQELIDYIVKSDFFYRNYTVEATVVEREPQSGYTRECLELDLVSKYEIYNPSNDLQTYDLNMSSFNVDMGSEVPPTVIKNVLVMDSNEKVIAQKSGDELVSSVIAPDKTEIILKDKYDIPSNSFITVRVSKTAYLRRQKDHYMISITRPTINMTVKFKFPNANYELKCRHYRPGKEKGGRFVSNLIRGENLIEARAIGGLLPYQGVQIVHAYKP